MNKIIFNKTYLITLLAIFTLSACGGGSDDTTEANIVPPVVDPPVVEPPVVETPKDKTFKISASAIVIKRISNDEALSIDLSAIKSEQLTLKAKG